MCCCLGEKIPAVQTRLVSEEFVRMGGKLSMKLGFKNVMTGLQILDLRGKAILQSHLLFNNPEAF